MIREYSQTAHPIRSHNLCANVLSVVSCTFCVRFKSCESLRSGRPHGAVRVSSHFKTFNVFADVLLSSPLSLSLTRVQALMELAYAWTVSRRTDGSAFGELYTVLTTRDRIASKATASPECHGQLTQNFYKTFVLQTFAQV